ncbi:hypothetical protein MMC26_000583 [Xylographa opegraphella]|nr:hypothetical protein [Xylographa opegraphella]
MDPTAASMQTLEEKIEDMFLVYCETGYCPPGFVPRFRFENDGTIFIYYSSYQPPQPSAANLLPPPGSAPGPAFVPGPAITHALAPAPASTTAPSATTAMVNLPAVPPAASAPPIFGPAIRPLPLTGPNGAQRIKFVEMARKGCFKTRDWFLLRRERGGVMHAGYGQATVDAAGHVSVSVGQVTEEVEGPTDIIKMMSRADGNLLGDRREPGWQLLEFISDGQHYTSLHDVRERYWQYKNSHI